MPSIRSCPPAIATVAKIKTALLTDRILLALGSDPALITDLLGDLSEEYADRYERGWQSFDIKPTSPLSAAPASNFSVGR